MSHHAATVVAQATPLRRRLARRCLNPATDPQARVRLLEALRVRPTSVTAAAKAAGYSRTHVYRVAQGDREVRAALEAIDGGRGRRRAVEVTVPSAVVEGAAAKVKDELEEKLAVRAIEALDRLGIILRAEPDGEVLYAGDQVRAAKVVLDLVRAPAKANVVTARTLGPGGASEMTATTTMTAEQRAALAEKMFGA